jgi:hypothetical protein
VAAAGFVRPVWEPAAAPLAVGAALPGGGPGAVGAWSTDASPVTVPVVRLPGAEATGYPRHVTALVGVRLMDDDWEPVEDQIAFGFEYDETDPANGHGWEAGLLLAGDDDDDGPDDVSTGAFQAYGGWRKTFRHDARGVHPYVGAGVAILLTGYEVDTPLGDDDDDDVTPGVYVRLGILVDVGSRMRCGLDYRHVFSEDVEIFGTDLDGDFDQFLFTFGWAF